MTHTRHILALSGGKDSSALAVYMSDPARWRRTLGLSSEDERDPVPEMEYVFCDTGKELAETYDYLYKLEAYLGREIIRLNPERGFDHYLEAYGGFLPSPQMRWCTRMLKLKPYEDYIADDDVVSYVGIRADENRSGYISTKPNIRPVFPMKEDGVKRDDVYRILEESGLGMPEYYKWRSRSGCFFCFYQRRSEWVGLKENHPGLYEEAKAYEKDGPDVEKKFTWSSTESLVELEQPERMEAIMSEQERRKSRLSTRTGSNAMWDTIDHWNTADMLRDAESDEAGCSICHI